MGLFGTDGSAGAGDLGLAHDDLGVESGLLGDLGGLGDYDANQYRAYDPGRVSALRQAADYWGNLARNGFTADQQNMLLGGGVPTQYLADQATSTGRLSDQLRGIDSDGGSSNSVTAGRDAGINDTAMNAYLQAKSQLGMMQMNMQQQAYWNQAKAYAQIVNPYQNGAFQGLGDAASGYGSLASGYAKLGEYENQMEQQNSFGGQLGGLGSDLAPLGSLAKDAFNMGAFHYKPGAGGDERIHTADGTLDWSNPSKYGFQSVEAWQAQQRANNPQNQITFGNYYGAPYVPGDPLPSS